MRNLFSIEFEYKGKKFSGMVRELHKEEHLEFHVRIMNARLDNWLYGRHVYRLHDYTLVADDTMCIERVQLLRAAVYYALQDHLRQHFSGTGIATPTV